MTNNTLKQLHSNITIITIGNDTSIQEVAIMVEGNKTQDIVPVVIRSLPYP